MAKRNIAFRKGRYYHIYNRGANRNKIFFEKENYLYLLRKLKEYSRNYYFSVIAYCLMPNHFHFLFRQDGNASLNIAVGYLFNTYTKAINKKYNRTGTLFEGHFKCIEVEDEKYLLELCRYIHRNPVDDKLVENIEEWEFSNYLEWVGERKGSLIDTDLRDKHFPAGKGYENYVMDYVSDKQARNELRKFLFEMRSNYNK